MQFAAVERFGLVDMIIPRLCLNSVALSGIRTTPFKNCSPGGKNCRGCSTSSLIPPVLHRPFWIRQASRAASAICSACKMGDAVHPPRRRKNAPAAVCGTNSERVACLPAHGDVSTVAGMLERARDGFGEETSGGGGKAERKIFSMMLARKVNRTETSLRNCAALSFICT